MRLPLPMSDRSATVLAFDTSTSWLAVAVAPRDRAPLQCVEVGGARASQRLLPLVQQLLGEASLTLADLDLIAFGAGPGAFTGLRASAAAAQGLAAGLELPVVPVPTLLAVAAALPQPTAPRLLVANDARIGEMYWAEATPGAEPALLGPTRVDAPARLAAVWVERFGAAPAPEQLQLIGNAWDEHRAALAAALPSGWSAVLQAAQTVAPSAVAIAALARAAWRRGDAVDAAAALPLYVRDKVALTSAERAGARA